MGRVIAYFDCFSGVSGDMALGALVDAGLPLDALRTELAAIDLQGYRLEARAHKDGAITGTRLEVAVEKAQPVRRLGEIVRLLESGRLDREVAKTARRVFERLARAEAAVHGVKPDEVQFHEVGAVDAIVDVVGVIAGLKTLGVERVYASSLPLGGGSVQSQHGTLPLPAPGTLGLLAEVGAPTRPVASDLEMVTPTGAALLAELATFQQPPMLLRRVGYGFGQRVMPWPNCLRIWLGDPLALPLAREQVSLLEANLDDMTAEALGFAMDRLFAAGALDVYFQPLQMKKNRPAVLLGVVARPAQAAELAALILAETTTLGVRVSPIERYVAGRYLATAQTELGPVPVKVKEIGGRRTMSPEYEHAARLARERGIPLADVYRATERAEVPAPPRD